MATKTKYIKQLPITIEVQSSFKIGHRDALETAVELVADFIGDSFSMKRHLRVEEEIHTEADLAAVIVDDPWDLARHYNLLIGFFEANRPLLEGLLTCAVNAYLPTLDNGDACEFLACGDRRTSDGGPIWCYLAKSSFLKDNMPALTEYLKLHATAVFIKRDIDAKSRGTKQNAAMAKALRLAGYTVTAPSKAKKA